MPGKKNKDPDTLSIRQRNLLFAVVKEYCEFGNTVSSGVLKEKYGFEISPATIRNEFIKLRELEYLYQPFTNSSSQPTEKSFKLFINQLIIGLQVTGRQQNELRSQIMVLEEKHSNLQKEISKLLSLETNSVGFAVDVNTESIIGIKNLVSDPGDGKISDILDFLENLDHHKQFLLGGENNHKFDKKNGLNAIFGLENPILPIGRGYAMVTAKATVNNQETVFGIITQPHILGRKKTLQLMNAINQILNEETDSL